MTEDGNGWAFPDKEETDSSGEVSALWVAGVEDVEHLRVALAGAAGDWVWAELEGEVRPQDAPPEFPDAALSQSTVAPAMPVVDFPLSGDAEATRVVLTPVTFPAGTFYVATWLPGFWVGLQNAGSGDAATTDLLDNERILLASVWNVAEGAALQLWSAPEVSCGPHTQDEGGLSCRASAAWRLGVGAGITTESRHLSDGESAPPEYAELGYLMEPCASAAGCTDLTVYLQGPGDDVPGRRLLAYRYARNEPAAHYASYIDVYAADAAATSCLRQASYQMLVEGYERVGGRYQLVRSPLFSAGYSSWNNSVCANYAGIRQGSQILLSTGGADAVGRPLLLGEPPRAL